MTHLTFDVTGSPAPQGSKRHVGNGIMIESSKKVKPWRQDVTAAAQSEANASGWEVPAGPVRADITYYLPRPKYHYRAGARANELKPNAPSYVDKKPDKDKLDRATFDALTSAGVIRDDAQIAAGQTSKRYADGPTGARISLTPLIDPAPVAAHHDPTAAGAVPTTTQEALL